MKRTTLFLFLLLAETASSPLWGQTLTGAHDPTVIKDNRCVYTLLTTNNLLQVRQSTDEVNWKSVGNIVPSMPGWVNTALGSTIADIWAPCIRYNNGLYWVYYACSSFGTNNSVIGVASNPTLDPTSANYSWTDRGLVIQSSSSNNYNCIDPDLFVDSNGSAWLAFGSFWTGIKMIAIDPNTGKQLATNTKIYSLASRGGGAIEGASLIQHGGYYYLFSSWDTCCDGVSSTYNTRMGRSSSVTGTYVDKAGTSLMSSGGTELLSSYAQYIGPGGGEAFQDGRRWYFAHHYYDANDNGNPYLQIREIVFDNNGWCQITQPYLGRREAFEAEHAALTNVAVSQTTSASNGDYVTNINASGSQVVFYLNALAAGSYEAVLRYANTGTTATQKLTVNGGTPLTLTYPSTGTTLQFSAAQTVTSAVTLVEGYNAVTIQPGTGLVALDRMDLYRPVGQLIPAGSDDHECSVTYQAAPNADVFSSGGDAQYENLDFGTGGYKSLAVSFFGGCIGTLTLTLDSLTGAQVAVTTLASSGPETLVLTLPAALQTTTGAHDLFVQFRGSGACSLGSFQFSTVLATPSLTPTKTATPSPTATSTWTLTRTSTGTPTPSITPTRTATPTATMTWTRTFTSTLTATGTFTFTVTATRTASPSFTPTVVSPTNTSTLTPTLSSTATSTVTSTWTRTSTPTATATWTPTFTWTLTKTSTPSFTPTVVPPTNTSTLTPTLSPTATSTVTSTWTRTSTPTATVSGTATFTVTATRTATASFTPTVAPPTSTSTSTPTSTPMIVWTATWTPPFTFTATWTATRTMTPTATGTDTATVSSTATASFSPTLSTTSSDTSTFSPTPTAIATASWTPPFTFTATWSATRTMTPTATGTDTATVSSTATASFSPTPSTTPSDTSTFSPTSTAIETATWTPTSTWTESFISTATTTPTPTFTATVTVSDTPTPEGGCAKVQMSYLYPNPVNRGGRVRVDIQTACLKAIRCSVDTAAYRKIEEWNATVNGRDTLVWDLKDASGKSVAAGLYYLVISMEGQKNWVMPIVVLP